jgi:hypothetical protein
MNELNDHNHEFVQSAMTQTFSGIQVSVSRFCFGNPINCVPWIIMYRVVKSNTPLVVQTYVGFISMGL